MSIDPDLLDPNYHYHWFNDEAGRIRSALASGYVFADAEETQFTAGDKNCELGSGAGMVAGRKEDGTVLVARLMKIRRDWWEANQADIQRHCDAVDKEISQGRVANVGPVDSQAFYVPKGHRNTLTRK